jgi:Raf kinase inhibitor-like YbhB/YbcL family protein
MTLKLESNAFYAGGRLPAKFTCDGGNSSPPLLWSAAPKGTRSFALVCSDPDPPSGTFYHWAVYDLTPDTQALPEGYPARAQGKGPRQAVNDFGRTGYGGPCPPKGHGPHRYFFRLYAMPLEALPVAGSSAGEVERLAEEHALATAELVGVYER